MGVMTNFTARSLRANRVRTAVTVAGVAFAAALLCAVLTTFTSLWGYLYDCEKSQSGSWMAVADGLFGDELAQHYRAAQEQPDVSDWASMSDVGFGRLTARQQVKLGRYLPIASYHGDIGELCAIRPSSGRLPESPDEILLWDTWRISEDLELGDTLTIEVGQRRTVLPEGAAAAAQPSLGEGDIDVVAIGEASAVHISGTVAPDEPDDAEYADGEDEHVGSYGAGSEYPSASASALEVGRPLNSEDGFYDPDLDNPLGEELVDAQTRTYTVVGFFDSMNWAMSCNVGIRALTCADPAPDSFTQVYLSYSHVADQRAVEQATEELFPDCHINYHTAMLRYMGIRGSSSIWDTFYGIVFILAAVIIAACISLIYNAFAISVAERSGQFGLLSSIGASRRQLRRAVLIEGFLVALMGIPTGVIIGIGGCAVTFHFLGPAIAALVGDPDLPFQLVVSGPMVAVVTVATLITVLVSAFVPAFRVSKTSPIEAQRQNKGGRVSKKGVKRAARVTTAGRLWKRGGIVSRLFGVGGMLARIGQKRGTTKGRAASVSLALAMVLLITAGSLNVFLNSLISAATSSVGNYEVGVTAQLVPSQKDVDGRRTARMDDAVLAQYEAAYDELKTIENARPLGWMLGNIMPVVMSPDMLTPETAATAAAGGMNNGGIRRDGTFGANTTILWLDDEAFDAYARNLGLNPQEFHGDTARAIALNQTYAYYDGKFVLVKPFEKTGQAEILTGGTYEGHTIDGFYSTSLLDGPDEDVQYEFGPYYLDEDGRSVDLLEAKPGMSLDLSTIETASIEIAYLAEEWPDLCSATNDTIKLILPMSALDRTRSAADFPIFTAGFNSTDGEHAQLADDLIVKFNDAVGGNEEVNVSFVSVNDVLDEADSNRMMALVVNVFCLLFAVILALIALANVFNTVTNSLILRRREFAVMKSVGLSNGQFRRMITDECIGFGLRGLIPGLIIATLVAYAMWSAIGLSLDGLDFTLPWSYIGGAIVMVTVAMVLSVAYGMHRCKADDVVAALRADSV